MTSRDKSVLFFERSFTEDYFSVKAISNSLLKEYVGNFTNFVDYWVNNVSRKGPDKDELIYGSLVDTLLTEPDKLLDRFIIAKPSDKFPTGQKLKFIRNFFMFRNEFPKLDEKEIKQLAYDKLAEDNDGKKLRDKIEIFNNYLVENKEIIRNMFLAKRDGKEYISRDIYDRAKQSVDYAKENKYLGALINIVNTDGVNVYYQFELYYNYHCSNGVILPIKVMLDKLIVNHRTKKIIPMDFKTTYDALNFERSIIDFQYYRQGSLYTFILREWANVNGYGDYEIQPFIFLALDKYKPKNVFAFYLSKNDLKVAAFGGFTKSGYKVKGFIEMLEEIGKHTVMKDWSFPIEILEQKYLIKTNIFREDE